jgi:hypothetical protein
VEFREQSKAYQFAIMRGTTTLNSIFAPTPGLARSASYAFLIPSYNCGRIAMIVSTGYHTHQPRSPSCACLTASMFCEISTPNHPDSELSWGNPPPPRARFARALDCIAAFQLTNLSVNYMRHKTKVRTKLVPRKREADTHLQRPERSEPHGGAGPRRRRPKRNELPRRAGRRKLAYGWWIWRSEKTGVWGRIPQEVR